MSTGNDVPKETSQDWPTPIAPISSAAPDQSEQVDSRVSDAPDQADGATLSTLVTPDNTPAPPQNPVAMATPSLPPQPAAHFQMVSQMASSVATPTAQMSIQQTQQQSVQVVPASQPAGPQTFHHLTTAQGATHQTIQYGANTPMMAQAAEQQTVHLQTTQAVMAHGSTGQQTFQLGLGQGLLAHGVGQPGIQGLVAQGSSMFGGTQIICSSDPSSNAQMESATMACQQYLTSPGLAGPQFMSVPQLQVIQTAPNQFIQQQFMYQNMPLPTAVHAVQNQPVAPQMTQGRPNSVDTKAPSILPAVQQQQQQNVAIRIALTNSYTIPSQTGAAKGMATVVPQQTSIFSGKQVAQKQQASPLVFAGVPQMQQPTILQSVRQAGTGSISFSPVQPAQIISNPTQFRFATTPNFIGNTAQMIGPNQALVNLGQFQTVPIVQSLIATQGTTILGSQPLYIRAADAVQPQQQSILGSVQTVAPTRHVANIAPQAIRPTTTVPSRRGVQQVQPNNSSATNPQTSSSSSKSLSTATPAKSGSKLPTLAKMAPVVKPNSAPSSAAVVPSRPPSQSGAVPRMAVSGTPVATVTAQSKPPASSKPEEAAKTEEKATTTVTTMTAAPPAAKQDDATVENTEKAAAVNSGMKEEVVSPLTKSVAAVLPTSVEKQLSEVKINMDEAMKNAEEKPANVKSSVEKENKPTVKPAREKNQKKSKPRVLTHIIEGFIIQEAMEPFPVNRSSLMSQFLSPSLAIPDNKNTLSFASQYDDDSEEEEEKEQEEEDKESPNKRSRVETEVADVTPKVTAEKTDEVPETEGKTVSDPVVAVPVPEPVPAPAAPVVASTGARLTCEFCGKSDMIQNFARSKRFCSVTCSKRFSAYSQRKQTENGGSGKGGFPPGKGVKRTHPMQAIPNVDKPECYVVFKQPVIGTPSAGPPGVSVSSGPVGGIVTPFQTSNSAECSSDTDRSTMTVGRQGDGSAQCSLQELERVERMDIDEFGDVQIPANKHLSQWGVQDVYNFVRTLPGCGMYADEFRQQEIDGQALMLLKEDHLMTTLNVKLGPALKICAKINKLKD